MNYNEDIEDQLKFHLENLKNIGANEELPKKVIVHLKRTLEVQNEIKGQKPENYRHLIEYLESEGRLFGWSYPENPKEDKCEKSFLKLKDSLKRIIGGMTANERLYFFGYLDEYEKLSPKQRSAREDIELKLFMQ